MRSIISIAAITLCFWSIAHTGRAGLARLYSAYSQSTFSLNGADRALSYTPDDPEVLYARALLHEQAEEPTEAIRDLEKAAALRPRDYLLWLELGRVLQVADEEPRALSAFQEAVRLAPYSTDARWQLGNLLLRNGRFEEAFAELRRASAADREMLPVVLELAWNAYQGNAEEIENAVRVSDPADRLALAQFLLRHGDIAGALQVFKSTKGATTDQRNQFVLALLAQNHFYEAFEAWSGETYAAGLAAIANGDFEEKTLIRDEGFGWQASMQEGSQVILDLSQARTGQQSALIEFTGSSNPGTAVLTQRVLVQPETNYQLRFATKSQNLITGGLPILAVAEATTNGKLLAECTLWVQTTSWETMKLSFRTGNDVTAVRISIQRQACSRQPCPAIGRLWLDDFSLQRL